MCARSDGPEAASLNVLLTSTCWRNDHNGFSHQGPGLIDTAIPLAPGVVRIWHPGRFHVRGFNEQSTTTTPFDMVVLNRMSRYHLVLEALRRSRRVPEKGLDLARHCQEMLERHHVYIRENFEDMPEVRDWTWTS